MPDSPQTENGYTRIADELLEALIKIRIPGQAMQVLLFILRKTYGFNKKQDAISLSQFEAGTGLSKSRICHCITKLEQINIIAKKGNDDTTIYSINKHYSTWKPLPKKETIAKKGKKSCEKVQSPLPNMGHTIDTLTIESIKKETTEKRFIKPTVEQVQEYCKERKNNIDPEEFIAKYKSNGWTVGKNQAPMKCWKSAVITWEKNEKKGATNGRKGRSSEEASIRDGTFDYEGYHES